MLNLRSKLSERLHNVSFADNDIRRNTKIKESDKRRPSVDIQSMKITDKANLQSTEVFHSILAAVAEAEADFDFGSDVEPEKLIAAQKRATSLEKPRNDMYAADAGGESDSDGLQEPEPPAGGPARSRAESSRRRKARRRTRSQSYGRTLPGLVLSAGFEGARPPGYHRWSVSRK